MHIVVFSGGEIVDSFLVRETLEKADLVIAADSGADSALKLGVVPDVVVGDMDSLDPSKKELLQEQQVEFLVSPPEKDETDTELAIDVAMQKGATEITIIGGVFGDRIDHVLANILYATVSKVPLKFINGLQQTIIKQGPCNLRLKGTKTDLLSLIPLTEDVIRLSSHGLQWELKDSTLIFGKPRGVSNVFTQNEVTLSWEKGWLFITHTRQA